MRAISVPARSVGWLEGKRLSRLMLILGAVILAALILGIFLFLLFQDVFSFGSFPSGVSVVGVNVAGLNKTEAIAKCEDELADVANKPLTLAIDDEKYQIPPEQIGLMLDYDKMVDSAYEKAWSVGLLERMGRRFISRPKEINIGLLTSDDRSAVQSWLDNAINSINRHPQDAYIDVTSGTPVIVPAKTGRNCPMDQLIKDTDAALKRPDRAVHVKVGRVPAELQDSVFGRYLLINLGSFTLTVYDRDKPVAQFPVAHGSSTFPTRVGIWKITSKSKNPGWYNPNSWWSGGMPAYIPPGPGNPLGTRAMGLNVNGEFIHGTPSSGSIGTAASHGCIRMYIKDAEALFEMVEVGTPVYVIKASGNPGFDVTRRPSWWK